MANNIQIVQLISPDKAKAFAASLLLLSIDSSSILEITLEQDDFTLELIFVNEESQDFAETEEKETT